MSSVDYNFNHSRSPTPPFTKISPIPRKLESRSESRVEHKTNQRIDTRSEQRIDQQRLEQQQRFELQQNFFNQQQVPYNPSGSDTPTSGRKLPVKTQSSMQKALSNKSQNFQVCQNLRTAPRIYQSHADLYQSKEKLFEHHTQPRYYSREPTPLAIITNKNVSEIDKFMHRHALPPVNTNMTSSQTRLKSSQYMLNQAPVTPQPTQFQFQLKKKMNMTSNLQIKVSYHNFNKI